MNTETFVYGVGLIRETHRELEWFEDYQDAEIKAIENSVDDDFWGVWDNLSNLEAIAYGGAIYTS